MVFSSLTAGKNDQHSGDYRLMKTYHFCFISVSYHEEHLLALLLTVFHVVLAS